jgi:hypothetical protein
MEITTEEELGEPPSLVVDELMPTIEEEEMTRAATPELGPATKRAKRTHERATKWRHKRTTFIKVPEEEFQAPTAFEEQAIEVRESGGRELRQKGKRSYTEYLHLMRSKAKARAAQARVRRAREEKQERK